jgi:Cu-Zn family superoxide dismutase
MHPFTRLLTLSAALMITLWGIQAAAAERSADHKEIERAVAMLHPTEGSDVSGAVYFTKKSDGVEVSAVIEGLKPGKHGFHIHELGDCTAPDAASAGGHYNPGGNPHAGPSDAKKHMGDMGNLEADSSGKAGYERLDRDMVLNGPDAIVGRAVIVHAGEDDLKSQPSGNAGGRLACGVVGLAAKQK